jgi:hypothetical protein
MKESSQMLNSEPNPAEAGQAVQESCHGGTGDDNSTAAGP